MTTYEYILLKDSDVKEYNLDDINALGKEGWRVVWTQRTDRGDDKTLLERVIIKE